jgi:hypothetical protein
MKILIILISLFATTLVNAQQAWTQKKGEAYIQIGGSMLSYSTIFNDKYKTGEIPRPITEFVVSTYAEYGFNNQLTGTLIIPYHNLSSGDLNKDWIGFAPEKGKLNTLGNINIALTYKFFDRKGIVLSSKLGMSTNTIKVDDLTGLRSGYDAFGLSPILLCGIGTKKYFASFESGVNLLSHGYLHRYLLNAQIGTHLLKNKKLLFIFGMSTSTSIGNSTSEDNSKLDKNASLTGLYLNEQSYYTGNIKLGFKLIPNLSIWFSTSSGIAKNIGQKMVPSISVGYNMKKKNSEN